MQIEKESLPDFWTGTITVGTGTAVQLSSAKHEIRKGVYLRVGAVPADALLSVGKTALDAANGFIIPFGETSPMLYVDDLSKLWLISTKDNTPVTWIAF